MLLSLIDGQEGSVRDGIRRHLVDMAYHENKYGGRIAEVSYQDGTLLEPMVPSERLLILGAGHVAKETAAIAAACGFSVTVCDDREEFVSEERFPQAKKRICDHFEKALAKVQVTASDYVVIVTRGHEHDAACLRAILSGTEPSYTGIIGSRKRIAGLFAQLREEGYDKDRLDRICTPIGLAIGARTPQEIAVSIAAELIAYRRLPEKTAGRICCSSDLENEVVRELASLREPAALSTVLRSSGSTPRAAGAKMLVRKDGSIAGTIGGGYAENRIREEALCLIGTGRYRIVNIDMSGSIAKEEGMVCGGCMQVLIEDIEYSKELQ